ncbi:MAG: PQQ-binding-like beta-propeller repeat protein [Kofleriaceae bacterium]|nr:PQQ-binding-like beta-propeller repeat protein [Kofleriaceae bacterium]
MKYTMQHTVELPKFCDALAVAPDGKTLAYTSTLPTDRKLRLYDAATLALRKEVSVGASGLNAVTISPDGKWAVTGAKSHAAYSVVTGKRGVQFAGHKHEIRSATFAPNGKRYYTASSDNYTPADWSVRAWDAATGAELSRWKCPRQLRALGVSPDGKLVAAGDKDGYVTLFDAATGKQRWEVKALGAPDAEAFVVAVAFSQDSKHVYASANGPTPCRGVSEISVAKGVVTRTLAPKGEGIMAVSGKLLFIAHATESALLVVDLKKDAIMAQLETQLGVTGLAVSQDAKTVYVGSYDHLSSFVRKN